MPSLSLSLSLSLHRRIRMFSLFFKKSCAAQVDAEALNLSRLDSENALERVEGHIQLAIIYRQQSLRYVIFNYLI